MTVAVLYYVMQISAACFHCNSFKKSNIYKVKWTSLSMFLRSVWPTLQVKFAHGKKWAHKCIAIFLRFTV